MLTTLWEAGGASMSTLVMKFGGASLGTSAGLAQALRIVAETVQSWDRLVIVVSALDGVTDMLLDAAHFARIDHPRGYRRIAANLRTRHLALTDLLPLDCPDHHTLKADLDRLISGLLDDCQAISQNLEDELSPMHSDRVVAVGERLSARIIAALLRYNDIRGVAVDGTELLVTDEVHGNANPELAPTAQRIDSVLKPILERDIIPVVSGFIGVTSSGATTTLGRGGADYSASVVSALLEADELWIWTDVQGMMTADPRYQPNAQVIPQLSYEEAADFAYFGARVLHARMIAPLAEAGLPLRIKNIFQPAAPGTRVSADASRREPAIKAVTSIQGIALRRPSSGSLAGATRLVGNTLFKTLGMRSEVLIASQSANSSFICFVIPTSIGVDGVDRLRRALEAKMAEYPEKMPWTIETVSLVTIIGTSLHVAPNHLARVLEKLHDIEMYAVALGASTCCFNVAMARGDSTKAIARLHEAIVRSDSDSA